MRHLRRLVRLEQEQERIADALAPIHTIVVHLGAMVQEVYPGPRYAGQVAYLLDGRAVAEDVLRSATGVCNEHQY